MKAIIGVMPLWDEEKKSIWMLPGYFDGIRQAGGLPFMFPFLDDEEDIRRLCGMCDGILFTGGQDVSPAVYEKREDAADTAAVSESAPWADTAAASESVSEAEERPDAVDLMTLRQGEFREGLSLSCPARDRMEKTVLDYVLEMGTPALGICRGHQFINAALGGTLYQDIPLQHPSGAEHDMKPPYDRAVHRVTVKEGTPLYDLLGVHELGVNSSHHQTVRQTAPSLRTMAVSEDGLIEAVYMPGHPFLWGVQWHPEFFFRKDEASRKILHALVAHASEAGCAEHRNEKL